MKTKTKPTKHKPQWHNPENVPVSKLPKGRRFLTVGEVVFHSLYERIRPEVAAWNGTNFSNPRNLLGFAFYITYCVPNSYKPRK